MDGTCCTGCGQLTAVERAARLLEVQPTASRPVVEAAYRKLAALHHPDKGGDEELMKRLNRARDLPLQPR
jgi:DnaJ homolog subfamily C member 19